MRFNAMFSKRKNRFVRLKAQMSADGLFISGWFRIRHKPDYWDYPKPLTFEQQIKFDNRMERLTCDSGKRWFRATTNLWQRHWDDPFSGPKK
jgi:hypothetical protein